ncbi:MAG TPA: magnesium/cobalt transporter CorA [Halanaerobiales bacterium]|nr:magnesium/cobalt transporter CorA [Halanaerobiales bacterium]
MEKIRKIAEKRASKAGQPPGSLIYLDDDKKEEIEISYIDYDQEIYKEKVVKDISECENLKESDTVTWINVIGLSDVEKIEKICNLFNIHPLVQEDIIHVHQRPKMEEHDDLLYIVLKMLNYSQQEAEVVSEQISIVVGNNYVITFQERAGDVFNPIRKRLKNEKGRIRTMKADYLAYSLIDIIIDNYFIILEKVGDEIEIIEEELVNQPSEDTLQKIYKYKNEMIFLRKSVWPLRELINGLEKSDLKFIDSSVKLYLRDLYDHTIQVIETVETIRDMLGGMLDIYLSSISNKMNEVMKVLTIIATIFIPLTFIAGIYGMNFEYMPELSFRNGYFVVLVVMVVIAIYMLYYFKKKKWL